MHKFFFLLLSVTIISIQSVRCQTGINELNAKIENVPDGTLVYFSVLGNEGQKIPLKTTKVENGEICIDLPVVDDQVVSLLTIAGVDEDVFFINENEPLIADIHSDNIKSSIVRGSDANKLLSDYKVYMNGKNSEILKKSRQYTKEELEDSEIRKKLTREKGAITKEIVAHSKKLIITHPNSLPSLFIFSDLMDAAPTSEMVKLYANFSTRLKETPFGEKLGEKYGKTEGISIGDIAPDFSAKTPGGKELSLQEVMDKKEKYTLIEFWASWCPFCKAEMPNVVKVYKKYHDKGLNILNVSIDGERSEWMEAIKEIGMNWDQISNLNRWDDPIVRLYHVTSVPTNYLLDENGKVIGIKLKGKDLENKMEELLGDQ